MRATQAGGAGTGAGADGPGAASPALVAAIRRILRPLVRLLVRRGLTYPWLADLLKPLFVEAAEAEIADRARAPHDQPDLGAVRRPSQGRQSPREGARRRTGAAPRPHRRHRARRPLAVRSAVPRPFGRPAPAAAHARRGRRRFVRDAGRGRQPGRPPAHDPGRAASPRHRSRRRRPGAAAGPRLRAGRGLRGPGVLLRRIAARPPRDRRQQPRRRRTADAGAQRLLRRAVAGVGGEAGRAVRRARHAAADHDQPRGDGPRGGGSPASRRAPAHPPRRLLPLGTRRPRGGRGRATPCRVSPEQDHESQPGAVFRRRGAASTSRDRGDPPAQLGAGGVRRRRREDGQRRHRRHRRRGTPGLRRDQRRRTRLDHRQRHRVQPCRRRHHRERAARRRPRRCASAWSSRSKPSRQPAAARWPGR